MVRRFAASSRAIAGVRKIRKRIQSRIRRCSRSWNSGGHGM
jgi:hypothetical protein